MNIDVKNKFNRQTVSSLVIALLALAALITGFVMNNSSKQLDTKSQEIVDKFYKYYNSPKLKVIYYGSDTCSYCSLQTPIMKQIKKDYKIDYLYVDSSKLSDKDRKEIIKTLDIKGATPTMAVVKNSKVIDVQEGYLDGVEMVKYLKSQKVLKSDAVYTPEQYLTFIDFNKYKELVASLEPTIVVIGQTTCSHCIAAKPVLSRVAGQNNITINYLNLTDMSEDEQNELINNLKELGYSNADNLGTPLTLVIKDNSVVSTLEGEQTPSKYKANFTSAGIITE